MFQGPFDQVYRFYYQRLNLRQKQCYNTMVEHIMKYEKEFELPCFISAQEVSEVFDAVRDDYPLFFFLNNHSWKTRGTTLYAVITYRILEKNVQPLLDKVIKEVTPLVNSLKGKTEEEKELAIHDYLVTHSVYEKDRQYYVHQILGPILYHKSVCEGFARAGKMLFDLVGMRSAYVTGCGNCYKKTQEEKEKKNSNHAWNLVFIKNVPYYLDITFDAGLGKPDEIWYAYYNMSEEQILRNHLPAKPELANCPAGGDYYTVRGLYIQRKSQLRELVEKYLRAGKKTLMFRMDFSRPIEEITKNVVDVIREVCIQTPGRWWIKNYVVYEPQYIFCVRFYQMQK